MVEGMLSIELEDVWYATATHDYVAHVPFAGEFRDAWLRLLDVGNDIAIPPKVETDQLHEMLREQANRGVPCILLDGWTGKGDVLPIDRDPAIDEFWLHAVDYLEGRIDDPYEHELMEGDWFRRPSPDTALLVGYSLLEQDDPDSVALLADLVDSDLTEFVMAPHTVEEMMRLSATWEGSIWRLAEACGMEDLDFGP